MKKHAGNTSGKENEKPRQDRAYTSTQHGHLESTNSYVLKQVTPFEIFDTPDTRV
mgnify:CR=1